MNWSMVTIQERVDADSHKVKGFMDARLILLVCGFCHESDLGWEDLQHYWKKTTI